MKATLEFSLPEEADDHLTAINGGAFLYIIQDFDNWLRNEAKYKQRATVGIDEARRTLQSLFDERGLRLNK